MSEKKIKESISNIQDSINNILSICSMLWKDLEILYFRKSEIVISEFMAIPNMVDSKVEKLEKDFDSLLGMFSEVLQENKRLKEEKQFMKENLDYLWNITYALIDTQGSQIIIDYNYFIDSLSIHENLCHLFYQKTSCAS